MTKQHDIVILGDGLKRHRDAMPAQRNALAVKIVTLAMTACPGLDCAAVLSFVNQNSEQQADTMLFEKAA